MILGVFFILIIRARIGYLDHGHMDGRILDIGYYFRIWSRSNSTRKASSRNEDDCSSLSIGGISICFLGDFG